MSKYGVYRTIRNGRVRIGGHWYRPDNHHRPYDGRLDGMRCLFGRYPAPWLPGGYTRTVSLWGTEAAARAACQGAKDWERPECVDGTLPWMFWQREE